MHTLGADASTGRPGNSVWLGKYPDTVVPRPSVVHCAPFIAIIPPQVVVYFLLLQSRTNRRFFAGRLGLSPSHCHATHRHCYQTRRHGSQAVLIAGTQADAVVTLSQMQNDESNSPLDRSYDF